MNKNGPPKRIAEFDPEYVRNLSEHVYRQRLDSVGEKEGTSAASMIAKDGDNGEKLRARAICFDEFSRCYLRAFGEVCTAMAKGLFP
jgi:hypothetical protein